jgi:hypothetical protein
LNKKSHTANYTFAVQKGKTTTKYAAALHYIYTRTTTTQVTVVQQGQGKKPSIHITVLQRTSPQHPTVPLANHHIFPTAQHFRRTLLHFRFSLHRHPPFRRVSPRVPPSWLVRVWGKHAARRRCGTGDGLRRHVCVFLSRGERREGSSAGCMLATGRCRSLGWQGSDWDSREGRYG